MHERCVCVLVHTSTSLVSGTSSASPQSAARPISSGLLSPLLLLSLAVAGAAVALCLCVRLLTKRVCKRAPSVHLLSGAARGRSDAAAAAAALLGTALHKTTLESSARGARPSVRSLRDRNGAPATRRSYTHTRTRRLRV